jgi:maleate isomerase
MADTAVTETGSELAVNRRNMAFELDDGVYARAGIGLIVLASDQVVEHEFRQVFTLPGVALFASRIYNDTTITPESLKAMEDGMTEAARLILPGIPLDVVAYGCTSGAMVIGDDKVTKLIHKARPGVACTTPMKATMAALAALGSKRVALLTPYLDEINHRMRGFIEAGGVSVPVMGSFNEPNDNKVGRISPESIRKAALELGRSELVDTVFIACTNMRLVAFAAELEAELGKPVTSSNHALAWHCLRLAGIDDPQPHLGRLFARPLAG